MFPIVEVETVFFLKAPMPLRDQTKTFQENKTDISQAALPLFAGDFHRVRSDAGTLEGVGPSKADQTKLLTACPNITSDLVLLMVLKSGQPVEVGSWFIPFFTRFYIFQVRLVVGKSHSLQGSIYARCLFNSLGSLNHQQCHLFLSDTIKSFFAP